MKLKFKKVIENKDNLVNLQVNVGVYFDYDFEKDPIEDFFTFGDDWDGYTPRIFNVASFEDLDWEPWADVADRALQANRGAIYKQLSKLKGFVKMSEDLSTDDVEDEAFYGYFDAFFNPELLDPEELENFELNLTIQEKVSFNSYTIEQKIDDHVDELDYYINFNENPENEFKQADFNSEKDCKELFFAIFTKPLNIIKKHFNLPVSSYKEAINFISNNNDSFTLTDESLINSKQLTKIQVYFSDYR